MKYIQIKALIGTVIMTWFLVGCTKVLNEEPRAQLTPSYFQTTAGVTGGITALYANNRNIWGNMYYFDACETGTDEATYGSSGSGATFGSYDFSGNGSAVSSQQNDDVVLWQYGFQNINTANGIIQYGAGAGVSNPLLGEARFFRAFDYFMLVQTFGGVPLDLGSGVLKFNTSQVRSSIRNTVPQVYTQSIFPDLDTAINYLPTTPRVTGGVTKALAQLYLAKAYLTYAWWLKNPNGIPTYPTVADPRVDPNGQTSAWYYQQAYNLATTAINNPGPFKLQASYYLVNVGSNDYNSEEMFWADHTQQSAQYNGTPITGAGPANSEDNFAGWALMWSYTSITNSKSDWSKDTLVNPIQRVTLQGYGRPWVRMAPPIEVIKNTFANKTADSRFDGTFQYILKGDWNLSGTGLNSYATLYNANDMKVNINSPILTFLTKDTTAGTVDYSNSKYNSKVGAGVLPGRSDYVIEPSAISRIVYPGLWKIGPYRTDNNGGLGQQNAGTTRPFYIAKFSELYFIAAEAAVEGATTLPGQAAYDLIKVIRARAGKWTYKNNAGQAFVADSSAAMIAATPAVIDINYILQERSREYYGEGYRWYDLVRTQTWSQIAATYTICGTTIGNHTPVLYTRTITPSLYLRPIPIAQINGMANMSAAEIAAYQNPGYQ